MSNNSFITTELGPSGNPRPSNFKSIITNHPAWHFPIGINRIDTKAGANARVRAYLDSVALADSAFHRFRAHVHLDAWSDTGLNEAGCTWLDVSKHSTELQFGSIKTGQVIPGADVIRDIQFDRWHYTTVPKVIVWLSAFDLSNVNGSRISTYVTDVNMSGFKLHVGTWMDAVVQEATVHWIAVHSNRPNMTAGHVLWGVDGAQKSSFRRRVVFGTPFERPPRVLVALNVINSSPGQNLRLSATTENVTAEDMTLTVSSWGVSLHNAVGVSYLAIEDPQLGETPECADVPPAQAAPDVTTIVENNMTD